MKLLPRPLHLAVLAIPLGLLQGCGLLGASLNEYGDSESPEQYRSVDRHSSYPAVRRSHFEKVNLLELVDPQDESRVRTNLDKSNPRYDTAYDEVLGWFRNGNPAPKERKAVHRNSVQDRILAVTTSRCNVFKTYLRRQQADVNFSLGSATTAAGVLGAVLPGVNSARNLAGAAGLFSGLQAEFNQAYYSNLAAHVIVQGIELRMNRMREELVKSRAQRDIDDYSMEAAIADAIAIDGQCSTVAGLMEAQDAVREVESPGLRMAARSTVSARALRELSEKPMQDLVKSGTLDALLNRAGGNVPSLMVTSVQGSELGAIGVALDQALNESSGLDAYLALRTDNVRSGYAALLSAAKPNPVGLSAEAVAKAFSDSLKGDNSPFSAESAKRWKACSAKVVEAAGELGKARALADLHPAGSVERVRARQEVETREALARSALALLDLQRTQGRAAIDRASSAVLRELPSETKALQEFTATQLAEKLKPGKPTRDLDDVCK